MHTYIQSQNQQVNRRHVKITYLPYGPGARTGPELVINIISKSVSKAQKCNRLSLLSDAYRTPV